MAAAALFCCVHVNHFASAPSSVHLGCFSGSNSCFVLSDISATLIKDELLSRTQVRAYSKREEDEGE